MANVLDNTSNQPSKFRTKNWVEISDELRGTHSVNRQINFKTSMYVITVMHIHLLKEIYQLIILWLQMLINTNEKVIFKNCAPFTDCISKINNTQIDNAKDIDMVIPIYNLIVQSDNYSKTSGSL